MLRELFTEEELQEMDEALDMIDFALLNGRRFVFFLVCRTAI